MNNMRTKILSLLVLLITAASGAWADYTVTWEGATLKSVNVASYGENNKTQTIGDITVTANSGYFKDFGSGNNGVIASAYETNGLVFSANAKFKSVEVTASSESTFNHTSGSATSHTYTVNPTATSFALPYGDGWINITKIVFTFEDAPAADGPEVATNAASEGATFTEASFQMPAFDATAEYELVRDMSFSMTTKVGDGNDGYRIRLKKSEQNPGKFEPADTDVAGMIAMIKVHDAIENQDLIFFNLGGSVDCTVSIYAIDEDDQPVGNPVAFQDLVPGRYIAKATAATGSTYDGETANSNVFVLFLGYPVEVPAGEFATFYKDEPLYADPISSADAELYTISSINNDKAVLSSAIETAPSKTPLLVYNNSDEAKTFLLIPADAEPNLSLDVYDGFIGTLTATTIAASDEDQTNYALNGKAFVYVKYAIPVAANKAWLNISNSNARVINIVFDETTGIANADRTKSMDDSWYTIDGRKVNAPTKKGVYILNGQKVVVK